MNAAAGHHEFVKASAAEIAAQLEKVTPQAKAAVKAATAAISDAEVEQHRVRFLADFAEIRDKAAEELPPPYMRYASRFDAVGLYQSVLAKVFNGIPGLQGYGNRNPVWVTTLLEQAAFKLTSFFHEVHEIEGAKKPLLQAVLEAWKDIKLAKAPYPQGIPTTQRLDETCTIALLADWGGDNPAARNVAETVRRAQPKIAIHLGDIYYGGVQEECIAFLRNWPMQADTVHPGKSVPAGSSLALNGNHEMYSGGEAFFNTVLPAFGQAQPFFCLENQYWRIIGLDTAYLGGRLKPEDPDDPLMAQWNWLVGLLQQEPKKATIFLSHHQPVSAHAQEFADSAPLRADIEELLETPGIGSEAIFGWFFGHEHRHTVYEDHATAFNARLIGSGCIPHEIQRELRSDPGCTPLHWVSNRGEDGSTESAISLYAELRFIRNVLTIVYTDERNTQLGHEQWDAHKGRLNGVPFEGDKTGYLTQS